ncbi:MAG: hypothetical protein ACREVB_01030 [Burkholderiales bacterium]
MTIKVLKRPRADTDVVAPSGFRSVGIAFGLLGLTATLVALVANATAANDLNPATLAWTFGLAVAGFAAAKLGIVVTLAGILRRLWLRVDSLRATLPRLKAAAEPDPNVRYGDIETPFGPATASEHALGPLPIHRMAQRLWAPMVAMGSMLVAGGFVFAIFQSGTANAADYNTFSAWTQGLQFLGEGLLLAGISFLLGTILAALRSGGGEVQESLGLTVKTLKMPVTAKLFVALMVVGLMAAMAQFALYAAAAAYVDNPSAWFAFLAPLREFALGALLSGIVLALYTIGTVLGFQFDRIKQIIVSGR